MATTTEQITPVAPNAGMAPSPAGAGAMPGAVQPGYKSTSLYVGDLDPDVGETTLFEVFNVVAPVATIRVCRNAVTRQSLGYAYVNFQSPADAEKAVNELNYTPIRGRPCRIMWSQRDPAMRRSNVGNIFIKNLASEITSRELHATFKLFGNILSCKVATDAKTGKSKGYGFVHFETEEAAKKAIAGVDGMLFGSQRVVVQVYVPKSNRSGPEWTNLYVKNLPKAWSEADLRREFGAFGEIVSAKVSLDEASGASKGFGFVSFKSHEDATRAMESLNGREVDGVPASAPPAAAKAAKKPNANANKDAAAPAPAPAPAGNDGKKEGDEESPNKDAAADKKEPNANANAEDDAAAGASSASVTPGKVKLFVGRAMKKAERERLLREEAAKQRQERASRWAGCNLYVRNLAESVDDDRLRKEFAPYGTITSARLEREPGTGRSKLFGYVCYAAPEEANKAQAALDHKMVDGKPLFVSLWMAKEAREQARAATQGARNMGGPGGPGGPRGGGMGGPGPQGGPMMGGPGGGGMGPQGGPMMVGPGAGGPGAHPFTAAAAAMGINPQQALMNPMLAQLVALSNPAMANALLQAQGGARPGGVGGPATPGDAQALQASIANLQQLIMMNPVLAYQMLSGFSNQQQAQQAQAQAQAAQQQQQAQQQQRGYGNPQLAAAQQAQAQAQAAAAAQQQAARGGAGAGGPPMGGRGPAGAQGGAGFMPLQGGGAPGGFPVPQQQQLQQQQQAAGAAAQGIVSESRQTAMAGPQQGQPRGAPAPGAGAGAGPQQQQGAAGQRGRGPQQGQGAGQMGAQAGGARVAAGPGPTGGAGAGGMPGAAGAAGGRPQQGQQQAQAQAQQQAGAGPRGPAAGRGAVPVPGAPQQPGVAAQAAAMPATAGGQGIGFTQQLAAASPQEQKNMIGERLYAQIMRNQPDRAGKITGMLLDGMDVSELLHLLESPSDLTARIQEALDVLKTHEEATKREAGNA